MRRNRHFLFAILFVFLFAGPGRSQEHVEERLLEEQDENIEQSELLEIISRLRQNPININSARVDNLEIIPGLTSNLALAIIRYRDQHGRFRQIDDLLDVPGMDAGTLDAIAEFLSVENPSPGFSNKPAVNWRTRVSERIDQPVGFKDGTYESSSAKIYNRLQFDLANRFKAGLLIEKDGGEKQWDDLRLFYLSSSVSEHLQVLIGHYQVEAGQGLVLWGPYGFSKGASVVVPVKKQGRGIRGYTSVNENASLFGGAIAIDWGALHVLSFASDNKLDASPLSEHEVSSIFDTGYHRNDNEKQKKDQLTERLLGAHLRYQFGLGGSVGVTIQHSEFDKEINSPNIIRNRFEFRGKRNIVLGFDWNWTGTHAGFFGEAARSRNGGRAILAGGLLNYANVSLACVLREYQKDFQNLHSFAFADQNGDARNERGFYTALEYDLTTTTKLSAFYDVVSTPWRTFFEPLPIQSQDFFSQIEHKSGRRILVIARYREKRTQATEPFRDEFNRSVTKFVEQARKQWRLQLEYRLSRQVRLRGRYERVHFSLTDFSHRKAIKEDGSLLYQEIRFQPGPVLRLDARLTFFHSDSFDSRIYAYEPDVPGVVANRALFGRGIRWYILLKLQLFRGGTFSLKYSELFRDDVDELGSGPDRIEGNLDRRFSLQMDMKM